MERWLSKSRVLLALCGVLLMAALNRQDPMVYAMFLFLAVLSLLGFVLPWVSLRGTRVHAAIAPGGSGQDVEGQPSSLQLLIHRRAWWPAFMVDVETRWRWASREIVLRQTVPVIRGGRQLDLGRELRFPCRGDYRLIGVTLASGFPLGLMRASQTITPDNVRLLVLPQAQAVQQALDWSVSEDSQGELTTRRTGQSFELGMLRKYEAGEFLGRVSWRASARIGDLVVQHFQQSASPLLRLVLQIPSAGEAGNPAAPSEQALRLAAGLCERALAEGVRLRAYLPSAPQAVQDMGQLLPALARAEPGTLDLAQAMQRAAQDMTAGEQLAVVVGANYSAVTLLQELATAGLQNWPVRVHIACPPRAAAALLSAAQDLQQRLQQFGIAAHTELA